MKNFDNFDDLVKRKLDGMEFPFEEKNWEKASQMIEATRPVKKPNGALWIAASIISSAIIVSAVYYFVANTHSSTQKQEVSQLTEGVSDLNPGSNEEVSTQKSSSTELEQTTQAPRNNSAEKEVSPVTANISLANNNNQSTSNTKVSDPTDGSTAVTKTSAEKAVKESNTYASNIAANNTKSSSKIASSLIGAEENAKYKSNGANKINTTTEKSTVSKTNSVYQPLESFTSKTETTLAEPSIAKANETSEVPTQATTSMVTKNELTVSAAQSLQPDTASHAIALTDYVKTKHHELNAEVGVVNSFGWMVNDKRNGNSLSPLAGLNYFYHFNPKSTVMIGAQYNSLSNLTESNVSYSITSYDFGVNNDVTTYKITGLHYLAAPIKYIHSFNKQNAFGIGMNVTYLLNTKNRIENYKTIESNVITTESKTDKGYGRDVTTNINAQLAISYHRKLAKNIGLNVELNRSVKNIFSDYNFFHSKNVSNKPYALKLSLTYSLFTK